MKKIRELLNLDDRMKLIVSVSAVGLLLLAAMLVPLAFRTAAEETAAPRRTNAEADKIALFAAYWNNGAETSGIQVDKPASLKPEQTAACEERMRALTERCIVDQGLEHVEPTGQEYTVLHGTDGTEVQLCRMWLEARGDWQNWLDVFFDSETGQMYYFYLSRECLGNRQLYEAKADALSGPEDVAKLLAEKYGWTLRYLSDGGESGSAVALFSNGEATLCYQIDCKLYDALIDIRICCK